MSVFDSTQIALMSAISGATLRDTVLANNIANADTPGFRPSDVNFHAALSDALGEGTEALENVSFAPEQLNTGAVRADGNGVDSDAEAAKLAESSLEIEALEQVAGSRLAIMRSAMGVNG